MSEHAITNAKAWMESIREGMDALQDLEAGRTESVIYDGAPYDDADELREHLQNQPLSVRVRGGWYSPGDEKPDPDEFEILLSTGGPAVRIWGGLDSHGEADGFARLQWRDWWMPWANYRDESEDSEANDSALQAFAALFYFGD